MKKITFDLIWYWAMMLNTIAIITLTIIFVHGAVMIYPLVISIFPFLSGIDGLIGHVKAKGRAGLIIYRKFFWLLTYLGDKAVVWKWDFYARFFGLYISYVWAPISPYSNTSGLVVQLILGKKYITLIRWTRKPKKQ